MTCLIFELLYVQLKQQTRLDLPKQLHIEIFSFYRFSLLPQEATLWETFESLSQTMIFIFCENEL
jgi:hypothetical protein